MNASGIAGFVLSCQPTTAPKAIIDEVRVATNWGYVTGGNPTFPISIGTDPVSRTVEVGDRVAFVVGAGGTSPSYQWRFNGTDIFDATNAAYSIASAQATNAGSYSVVVTNVLNALTSAPAVLTVAAMPLRLYETNLAVVRVGDGAQTLSTSGNSVFLDQFTPGGTYVNTIFIPDTGASALIEAGPDIAGTVLTGTALTRSADKRLLVLAGYNVALGNATALQDTTSAAVPRGVVTIDAGSQTTLAIAETSAYSATHFRGAASDGNNNFWGAAGAEGTYYFGLGSAADSVQTTFGNTRSVDIFGTNLYCVSAQSANNGVMEITGLPTGAGTATILFAGNATTTDLAVNSNRTLIYVTSNSGIHRWDFDGVTWVNTYTLNSGISEGARYVTADFGGVAPVIYATTSESGSVNRLVTIVDTDSAATAVTLATSGPNQLFKGIRFGPSAGVRPALSFTRDGSDLILSWSGPFSLISSTNVLGPYLDVQGATNPYTNSTVSEVQRYFGLRQN